MDTLETLGLYESPLVEILEICSNGILCVSGTNESLVEDDSWIELLD